MEKAGLYIHIPFCASKCPYCDFYSGKYTNEAAENYASELIEEFCKYSGAEFDTVYFGGGTPSILQPQLIAKILEAARKNFKIADNSEITIECNPSKDLKEDIAVYAGHGINRISLGMQSAVKEERQALGRIAGKAEIERTLKYARNNNIKNISLDLMLGTPKQSLQSLDESLNFIADSGVPHISAYMLKIEDGTPFYRLKDRLPLPNEDETAEMYLKTVDRLESMGIMQYEISNFAKPGFESRHNIKYWKLVPYLGLGKSAHSFWGGKRFHYDADFNKIDDGTGGGAEEQIMLGLRLKSGIDEALLKADASAYVSAGFMERRGSKINFTPKGFLVSNTIISELI